MKNNIYLYLILISLLVGGFSGFIGYDHFEKAERYKRLSETMAQSIEGRKEELRKKEIELVDLEFERYEKQATIRGFAQAILEQQDVQKRFSTLRDQLEASVTRQKMIFSVNQKGMSDIQDQLAEDTTSIERQSENMRTMFDLEKQRLVARQNILQQIAQDEQKLHAVALSGLETAIKQTESELERIKDLHPTEIKEPWIVGKVLDFYAPLNKVVINLGSTAGIRQNFQFMIFSDRPGKEREYKGMVVIKDVEGLVSTGTMLMAERESRDPVAGDSIGSVAYRRDAMVIYLGGDFRAKYQKNQLVQLLEYTGNRVVDDLDANVDFFVMGALADNEIPLATSLGVSLIPESLITPYLGE